MPRGVRALAVANRHAEHFTWALVAVRNALEPTAALAGRTRRTACAAIVLVRIRVHAFSAAHGVAGVALERAVARMSIVDVRSPFASATRASASLATPDANRGSVIMPDPVVSLSTAGAGRSNVT